MQVTVDGLEKLLEQSKRIGTLEAWADVALMWMRGAEEHIAIAFHPEIGWATKTEDYIELHKMYDELIKESQNLFEEYVELSVCDPDELAKKYHTIGQFIKNHDTD
jgi:hypothetical protein